MSIAYSYVRFSHPDQAKGDSLRRQTEATSAWCKRNDVALDTSLTLHDLGKSAFRGKHRENPDRNALAAFLQLVEDGRVPKGSYLIVEALDRLTREDIQPALRLILDLLEGVRIVQLKPSEMVYDNKSGPHAIMLMIVELMRGHSESEMKSERVGAAWAAKKADARTNGTVQTTRTPAWLEVVDRYKDGKHVRGGSFKVIPSRAKIVRQIFALACKGYGLSLIVKKLTDDKIDPFGWGKKWSKRYVHKILTSRAVLGEYQPHKNGDPEGDAIPGYYPTIGIDDDAFQNAQAALASRRDRQGRIGHKVASLFTGLVWDALTQSKMQIGWQTRGSGPNRCKARVLVSADSMEGRAKSISFPYPVFEEAILSLLQEVRPADILGEEPEGESLTLAAELATVEQRLARLEEQLTGDGDIAVLARAAKTLDAKRTDLLRRLAEARQKEAHPRSAAWAEAKSLLDVVDTEANRLRLRSLLRQIIDSIWMVVSVKGSHRLATMQINFVGGTWREFWIHTWSAGNGREGGWEARSHLFQTDRHHPGLSLAGGDLRNLDTAWCADRFPEQWELDVMFGRGKLPRKQFSRSRRS